MRATSGAIEEVWIDGETEKLDVVKVNVDQEPDLGAWLRRAVRTGNLCSFRPGG